MRKLRALFAILVILFTLRWVACSPAKDPGSGAALANRVWVDKVSAGPRDMVLRLVLVERGKVKNGVIVSASKFRALGERLSWRLEKKTLHLKLPQERQKVSFQAKTYGCDGPGRFDLCLDLKRGDRVLRLYSEKRARWRRDAGPELGAFGPLPRLDEREAAGAFAEAVPPWFDARAVPAARD